MKILAVNNLFPPHQADTDDFRCQNVTDALRERGHTLRVLTSTCGLATDSGHTARNVGSTVDQRDAMIQRRLRLNGVFGAEPVRGLGALRELEARNNAVLHEALAGFAPDVVLVGSLHGLSKSLLLALRRAKVPTVFDVADRWIADELRDDPWLDWWHRQRVSLPHRMHRLALELFKQRSQWDAATPTFIEAGVSRMPGIFDRDPGAHFKPNSIAFFQFRRLYFSSPALKSAVAEAGFRVSHGEVIHPGVNTRLFHGEVKPVTAPVKKFLVVTNLHPRCGVATAIDAVKLVRAQGAKVTLTVFGRGNSQVLSRLRTSAAQSEVPVEFRGSGTQKELPNLYQVHDALIHPVEREEPYIGPPLEAMACGLPVIVNQDHGAEDLFRSRESCLTFPSGDAGLLANRMLELIEQPALRVELAQVGQNEVLTRYQFATAVEQIEQYLEDTVAQWQSA